MPGNVVIKVHKLKKYFELRRGFLDFGGDAPLVKAVDDVDFVIREGEILGLVGESGCGKTTTGRLLTRLEDPTAGDVFFLGRDTAMLEGEDLKIFRRNIQMVFQDPYESLNPRNTVLQTVMEPLINHRIGDSPEERVEMATKALEDAGLAPAKEYLARFPHELSGGQRQRVSIARALVMNPKVIVADEPVSMLDVSIRAGVLNLMLDLRDKYRIPYLFITHDIAVARYVSDRLGVMYLGKIVEIGETDEVVFKPKHPYTQALLSAVPVPDPTHKHGRISIKGEIPSAINVPLGCRFRPRCPHAFDQCGFQAEDLADWLMEEEKVQNEKHPMFGHIGQLHPDGFTLTIAVGPGGQVARVRQFIESRIADQKASRPMFQAIWSVKESLGTREVHVKCSSVKLTGEEVAQELLDLLLASVEFKERDHPMYDVITDMKRDGARVLLKTSATQKALEGSGGKTNIETAEAFLKDFVSHYARMGYTELKGVRNMKAEENTLLVVADCRPARMSAKRVAKEASKLIEGDVARGPVMPLKVRGGSLRVRTHGPLESWEDLVKLLEGRFKGARDSGSVAARGIGKMVIRTTKGAQDTVVVRFIRTEEPPLLDLGGGHLVACYLYKPAAK